MPERTARNWFTKFKNGDFYLEDAACSGRPVEIEEERLNQLLHEEARQITRELAKRIHCSQITIV